jgi:carbon storage regulator
MLVFTRKRDQAIIIGDGIEIRVIRIGHDSVRIGITAPSNIPVHRHEIYELICAANLSAAASHKASVESLAKRLRRVVTGERGEPTT